MCFNKKKAALLPEMYIIYTCEENQVIWRVMENQQMRQQCLNHNTSSIKVKNCHSGAPLACFFSRSSVSYEAPAVGMCPGVPAGLHATDRSLPDSHEAVRPWVPARRRLHVWWLQVEEEPERDLPKGSVSVRIWNHQNLYFLRTFLPRKSPNN